MGISRESSTAQIFGYPSQERVKLRTLNFVHTFIASVTTKNHETNLGKVAVGIVRESRKFFRAPVYGAQLSCYLCFSIYIYILP